LATAFNEPSYFLSAIEIGVDAYVQKPVDPTLLYRALNKAATGILQKRELAEKNAEMQRMLQALQRYHDDAEEQNRVTHDLMQRMLRVDALQHPRCAWRMAPATYFSGDLIAVSPGPQGEMYAILADATGHGLAAAVNLPAVSRIFYKMAERGRTLPEMLTKMNTAIREYSTADRFMAVTLVRFDPARRQVELWNGGNPPALCLDTQGQVLQSFRATAMPLGVAANERMNFTVVTHALDAHAVQLLLLSDGVEEAYHPEKGMFSQERVVAALKNTPVNGRLDALMDAVRQHLGDAPALDDLTALALDLS
jgi:serine phosphatase RsbU (regulator of sigma subunit)